MLENKSFHLVLCHSSPFSNDYFIHFSNHCQKFWWSDILKIINFGFWVILWSISHTVTYNFAINEPPLLRSFCFKLICLLEWLSALTLCQIIRGRETGEKERQFCKLSYYLNVYMTLRRIIDCCWLQWCYSWEESDA